jgi:hypothetical protein
VSIDDLLDNLEAAEQDFEGTEFLAPIIGTNKVQVRIAGIICQLTIEKNLPKKGGLRTPGEPGRDGRLPTPIPGCQAHLITAKASPLVSIAGPPG